MTQEMITTILSIVSSILMAIMGWLLRRFVKDYDEKFTSHEKRIDEADENCHKTNDRVLTLETKIPNLLLEHSKLDDKLEKFSAQFAKSQTEIIQKLNALVSKESWGELRDDVKNLTVTLNKFLIAQGETNIKINNLEKSNDELFRILNNQKIKGE